MNSLVLSHPPLQTFQGASWTNTIETDKKIPTAAMVRNIELITRYHHLILLSHSRLIQQAHPDQYMEAVNPPWEWVLLVVCCHLLHLSTTLLRCLLCKQVILRIPINLHTPLTCRTCNIKSAPSLWLLPLCSENMINCLQHIHACRFAAKPLTRSLKYPITRSIP